jgi:hypothetical protein
MSPQVWNGDRDSGLDQLLELELIAHFLPTADSPAWAEFSVDAKARTSFKPLPSAMPHQTPKE